MTKVTKKTLVIGASLKPNRYSNYAIQRLVANGVETVAIGRTSGEISGVHIDTVAKPYTNIHTVTLYLSPKNQEVYYNYVLDLKPKRVIFNPGTENSAFYQLLKSQGIVYEEACTLVLLSTNQY